MGKSKRKYRSSNDSSNSEEFESSNTSSDDSRDEEIFKLKKRIRRLQKHGRRRTKLHKKHVRNLSPSPSTSIQNMDSEDIQGNISDKENQDPLEIEFVEVEELDKNTLSVLGKSTDTSRSLGEPIQKDIASQWEVDIQSGLAQEVKDGLLKKYLIPQNLQSAQAPRLNPEIKAAINETSLARDLRLEKVQLQMGLSLAALGKAQSLLLSFQKEEGGEKLLEVIEAVNDGARLLADVHHDQSVSRQNVVSIYLDKSVREVLNDLDLDGWLFGKDLGERIKTAKAIKKSGQELKQQVKPSTSKIKPKISSGPKNGKAFPRYSGTSGQKYQSPLKTRSSFRTGTGQQSRFIQRNRERSNRRYQY